MLRCADTQRLSLRVEVSVYIVDIPSPDVLEETGD